MKKLEDYVLTIPDFPEPGIMFRDITSVIQAPEGLKLAVDGLTDLVRDLDFDLVIGPESRGFIFGVPVAYLLGKGFVPVRKKGKLPRETVSEKYDLDLLVLNDIDTVLFQHIGLRPGFWPTSPDTRVHVVPEGDIGSGVASLALKWLTGQHVNYIEPFHIDLPSQTFDAGHAGPNDYTDPRGRCKISSDVRFAKTKWKYAGAPFAWYVFPEGRKTMLHCSQQTGKFQFVLSQVEAVHTDHFLATYSHSHFRPVGEDCRQLFSQLIRQGVTQHYGITDGDWTEAVRDLAMMLGIEFHVV